MTFTVQAAVADRAFDVEFTVGPAETVAVMGPNGAGKSTLLDIIAGLLQPDAGRAELDGKTLFDLTAGRGQWTAPHRRGTALLAQEPLLFPHLSVLENVAFGPRSAGAVKRSARESALHWLAEVEATDLAARKPAELSGGQAQRVAVARALATNPGLLLLDEPMASLDIHAAPLLRRLLKRVLAGQRAIIITHDALDALMLAERVIILEDGRISEEGPTSGVLQRPRSRFAAGLAGLNFVAGSITGHGLQAGTLNLHGQHEDRPGPLSIGQPGVAVFPPSAVSIFLSQAPGSPRNSFAVTITDVEPHGDGIRVRAGAAGQLSADITVAAAADLALVPGMPVYFVVKAGAVAVYPC